MLRYRDRGASEENRGAAQELTALVRGILGINDDTVVSVSEHCCGDPTCGDAATTIVVMPPDQPISGAKIAKPIAAITEDDVRRALSTLR